MGVQCSVVLWVLPSQFRPRFVAVPSSSREHQFRTVYRAVLWTVNTLQLTELYCVHCTVHTVQCTLYSLQSCTVYSAHFTVYRAVLCTVHTVYALQLTELYCGQWTLYGLKSTVNCEQCFFHTILHYRIYSKSHQVLHLFLWAIKFTIHIDSPRVG